MSFNDVLKAFNNRDDLKQYGENALMLWAMELRFEIDDIHSFASNYLTDGPDDKKCDLLYINRDDRFAILAQDYFSNTEKRSAPANKASDLNTAVSWLIDARLEDIPDHMKHAVGEFRDALNDGLIDMLYIYYFHNLPESHNVQSEMGRVAGTARRFVGDEVGIVSQEIGQTKLSEWYDDATILISIQDEFEVVVGAGYEEKGDGWSAYVTTVSASWLYAMFQRYSDKLFSANQRSYLGSRRTDSNINNGIKQTAQDVPGHFWAFNNGITLIVEKYEKVRKKLVVNGLSIINGAQTTGAIGSLSRQPSPDTKVLARFIKCDSGLVADIVRYNNSQNQMVPSDFRSNDSIQRRLVREFEEYGGELYYDGGRRGGASDRMQRNRNRLSSDRVAQSLTSFHGDPVLAYNYKARLWNNNGYYQRIFNDNTSCKHIVFVYSLHEALLNKQRNLKQLEAREDLTEQNQSQLEFFRIRGGTYLLIYAISQCMETILDRRIPSKFDLRFRNEATIEANAEYWMPIIDISMSFSKMAKEAFEEGGRDKFSDLFSSLMASIASVNRAVFDVFADHLE